MCIVNHFNVHWLQGKNTSNSIPCKLVQNNSRYSFRLCHWWKCLYASGEVTLWLPPMEAPYIDVYIYIYIYMCVFKFKLVWVGGSVSTISSQRALKTALHHPICVVTTLVALIYPPQSAGDYLDPIMDTNTKKWRPWLCYSQVSTGTK